MVREVKKLRKEIAVITMVEDRWRLREDRQGVKTKLERKAKAWRQYVTEIRGEEIIMKIEMIVETKMIMENMEEIKKEIKEKICKQMKNTNCEIVMEQIELIGEESEGRKTNKRRRKKEGHGRDERDREEKNP